MAEPRNDESSILIAEIAAHMEFLIHLTHAHAALFQ